MAEIIDGNTIDIVKENLKKLQEIYPEAFTEGKVDPQKLLLLLGEDVDSSNEKYSFTWKGKNDCIRLAQSPSKGTLLPCKEESVDWDTTKNLYIEGDNLEVLKLLQKSYLGKVKMIYIDPPYNTGHDFVYEDDFSDNIANYKQVTGQAHRSNAESAGRYHTNWLNMIYPRLKIARTLLSKDGIIFISIDDNEVSNLKKVCDEIFGETNFLTCITRATGTPTGGGFDGLVNELDYVLCYAQNINYTTINGLEMTEEDAKIYDLEDERGRYLIRPLRRTGGEDRREDRPTMFFPIEAPDGTLVYPIGPTGYESRWICSPDTAKKMQQEGLLAWKKTKRNGEECWQVYQKFYLDNRTKAPGNLWTDVEGNKKATRDIRNYFDTIKVFDFPKPVGFLEKIIEIGSNDGDIVLDFFSGSATTADAIMKLNSQKNISRKFILVQLPELCNEETDAYKAGYKNICEIGKERIRRAGKLIKEQNSNVDTGFRVFKLDSSNLTKWDNSPTDDPNEVAKRINDSLFYLQPDRTEIDFVYEIMLKLGMPLSNNVEIFTIEDKKVYGVKDGAYSILICLEYYVNFDLVEKLAESEYEVLIFADRCFADANMLINTEEILKKKGKTLKLF